MMLAAIRVVLGLALLFLGRRLFWLFVGAVGFALGAFVATQLIEAGNVLTILIALGGGLVGILLALFLQSLAIGLAGFVAGALILQRLIELIGLDVGQWNWVVLIIGGIVGAVLAGLLFDWALIILSSLTGAGLLLQPLDLAAPWDLVAFIGLALVGILAQSVILRRRPPAKPVEQQPAKE